MRWSCVSDDEAEARRGTLEEFGKRLANVLENLFKLSLVFCHEPTYGHVASYLSLSRSLVVSKRCSCCWHFAVYWPFCYFVHASFPSLSRSLSVPLVYACLFSGNFSFSILYSGEEIENFH